MGSKVVYILQGILIRSILIAVAGPYTADSAEKRASNLDAMNIAAAEVYKKGHTPVIGVNAALFIAEKLNSLPKRDIINKISFAIVEKCNAILIISESPGVDDERRIIESKGLTVFYSIEDIPQAE